MPLPRLEGRKITLRQLRRSDAEDIRKNANSREVGRYIVHLPYPYSLRHARSWIERSLRLARSKKEFHFGITEMKSGRVVGMVGLRMVDFKNGNAEVGFWIGKNHWNKGYTTEAVKLITHFAFNKLKLERIYAVVLDKNIASARVLEKNGFKREGTWRKAHVIGRNRHDVYGFGIMKNEFKALRCL